MARWLPAYLPTLILINLTGHMALSGGRLSGSMFLLRSPGGEVMVGVFMALFSVIPVVSSLAVGRWVDRVGSPRVMRTGISLVLAGAWLPVMVPSVPLILAMAMTVGFGFNVITVAAQHSVGHLEPDGDPSRRLANFGWFALGHSASSAMGPFIAGLLIDHVGFRAAFATIGAFSVMAALLVFLRARGLPGPAQHRTVAPLTGQAAPVARRATDLLASAELRRIYWVNMAFASGWDLFFVALPVVGHRLGYSASVIGTVFSMFAIGTFAARAAMPWLARRVNEWQILRVALVMMVLVFLVLPFTHVAALLMLLGLAFGCSVGTSQPNILSLLHAAAPPGRGGEAVGMRSVLSNGCSVVVPLSFGAAVVALGVPLLVVGGGLVLGSALWPAHRGARARRRTRPIAHG